MNGNWKLHHLLSHHKKIGVALLFVLYALSAASPILAQRPPVIAVSAASFAQNSVLAPNSMGAVFGANMSGGIEIAAGHPLPLQLAGVLVNIRDATNGLHIAPLYFVSPQQINFLVPADAINGPATIIVVRDGIPAGQGTLTIERVTPGLFSFSGNGQGLAAAEVLRLKSNGTLAYEPLARFNAGTGSFEAIPISITESEPAALVIYGTGFRNNALLNQVSCTIGGENVQVFFAGAQPTLPGLDQANVRLSPSLAGRSTVNIVLNVAGKTSNTVTVTVQ
jgi:uncharacterized protein (TIGR03437 family)